MGDKPSSEFAGRGPLTHYSSRNATVGSRRAALRAGAQAAATAMTEKTTVMATKVALATGLTPTRIASRTRVLASASDLCHDARADSKRQRDYDDYRKSRVLAQRLHSVMKVFRQHLALRKPT